MALEIDEVARLVRSACRGAVLGAEEVVETDLEQGGERGIRGNVATDARIVLVLFVHHGHGIPADQRFNAALQLTIAGVRHLVVLGDGVQVGRGDVACGGHAGFARPGAQRG